MIEKHVIKLKQANKLQNNPPLQQLESSLLSKIKILHGRINVIFNSMFVTSLFKYCLLLNVLSYQLSSQIRTSWLKKKKDKLDAFK